MPDRANCSKRKQSYPSDGGSSQPESDILGKELREAIRHMVANISKSFIVEWYTSISQTNHDFVARCETSIEDALTKLAELSIRKFDKYKTGQLVSGLIHDHILSESSAERRKSIEHQIDNYEYDICQSSVVRLFGLLCSEEIRRVIITDIGAHHEGRISHFGSTKSYQRMLRQNRTRMETDGSTKTTSALYTLVIAMLTKAVFMPIVSSITEPNWLYAVIIWLCKKEEREQAQKAEAERVKNCTSNNGVRDGIGNASMSPKDNKNCPDAPIIITRSYRSLDLEEGIDIASANINFENPIGNSLKRPLDNIEIFATEEVKGNNSCYILYSIRYDALCCRHPSAGGFNFIPEQPDVPIIDKRQTYRGIDTRMHETRISDTPSTPHGKYYRRSMTIKRRFREFVLLQLRLEENPKIRPHMKNIPKPTKLKAATQNIFSLPGITNIKLDQSTIKLRQRFLERFLKALNGSPFIANSYEFKEFFSYNINPPGTSLSKSKSLILQVNLNKVFVDSVRSAFSIIRSSLPASSDEHRLESNANANPDAWLNELQQSTLKLHIQTRTSHSKMNLERLIDSKLLSINHSGSSRSSKSSSLGGYYSRDTASTGYAGGSRGGSLKSHMVKSPSFQSNTLSSVLNSRTPSSNSREIDSDSSSDNISECGSSESIYHDASSEVDNVEAQNDCNSIQICHSIPIATKLIDIVHYSINRDSMCNYSSINFIARLFFGKTIERYAVKVLDAVFNLKIAAFCINGITSSIWEESDDPPLDLENSSLEEAVSHLTRLLEKSFVKHPLVPKNLLRSVIKKQIEFYLSQLRCQKRNKFVVYSFLVQLLDELENNEQ